MELFEVEAFIYSFLPKAGSSTPSATKGIQHRWILCAVSNVFIKKPRYTASKTGHAE